jgi:hypothetical protein
MQVTAMEFYQSVPGQLSQPWVKRNLLMLQVFGKLSISLEECVLNHVGWVNACSQAAV